jgi:hypothetical protein
VLVIVFSPGLLVLTAFISLPPHRDKALQNFHTLKIREINKIIRELWQLIYKGQDIDSIEIESGQEEGAAATKSSRSYNYRVVMRKGMVKKVIICACLFRRCKR